MIVDKELLEILACPKCKGRVHLVEAGIACDRCRIVYPVKDGIPVMLADEAVPMK